MWVVVLVAACALIAVQSAIFAGSVGSDFGVFHDSAERFLQDPARLYHRLSTSDAVADIATLQGWLYAPPAILPFLPLALGDRAQSFAFFSPLTLVATAWACWLWLQLVVRTGAAVVERWQMAALIAIGCASGPAMLNRFGQIDTFVLLVCVSAVALFVRGRATAAGALLAAGAWLKIYPALLLAGVWGAKPQRPIWGGFGAAAIIIPLTSLILVPASLYRDYFLTYLPIMSQRAIINIYNQSLSAVWLRAANPDVDFVESFAALPVPGGLRLALAAALIAGIISIRRKTAGRSLALPCLAAWIMASMPLVAPLGWGHSYALALPLLLLVVVLGSAQRDFLALAGCAIAFAAMLVPAYTAVSDAIAPGLAQLIYARYPIATLLLMVMLWRQCHDAALKHPSQPPI